tara:strand:+ start:15773 stop:17755 length:1983 start_codon:yes stop_codon:yes gene_type:complete
MPQTFTKITQESFNWSGLASNIDSAGGIDTIKILSRYANKSETHPAIENFDSINMGLTPIYASDNNAGTRYAQFLDVTSLGGSNRDPYDRYVWSGEVQTDANNNSKFTHTVIDGVETDGCLYVPDPFFKLPANFETDANGNSNQAGVNINLQFNDLAPYQWVPLFGIYFGRFGSVENTFTGQNWDISYGNHASHGAPWPYYASQDGNNLYGVDSDYESGYFNKHMNHVQYWIYCHDGNGNAMIATTTGENLTDQDQTYPLSPTNEHYGSSNGYMKYSAPYYLRNYVATQSNPLPTLWEDHGGNNSGRNEYSTHHAAYVDYRVWASTQGNACIGVGYADASTHLNSQLVAYGATANADLSTPTNLYITVNKTTNDAGGQRICSGFLKAAGGYSSNTYTIGHYITGKIGDFTFMNVPGVVGTTRSASPASTSVSYGHPTGLILRPPVLGDGQINSFAYGSFHSDPHPGNYIVPAGDSMSDHMFPGSNIEYIYPTEGGAYDPVLGASNNIAMLTDESGVQMSTKTDPSFDDVEFLLDDILTTKTTIKKSGAGEALYIALNTAPAVMALNDADAVTDFVMTIRGVTQVIIGNYRIMAALTDSAKTEITRTDATTAITAPMKGSSNSNPSGGGQYTVHFLGTDMQGTTYGDIKAGYLKIWAELVP